MLKAIDEYLFPFQLTTTLYFHLVASFPSVIGLSKSCKKNINKKIQYFPYTFQLMGFLLKFVYKNNIPLAEIELSHAFYQFVLLRKSVQ